MRFCGNLAMFLLLVWLALCASAAGEKGRKGKKEEAESGVAFSGKFSGRSGQRCTWAVRREQQYTLKVTCPGVQARKQVIGYTCEYRAELALCPAFLSSPSAFWRQMSSGIRRQKRNLCRNARKTLQAEMCQSAPEGAHFRLVRTREEITMTTTPAARAGLLEDARVTECTKRADHQQLAQEKCGTAWASFCNLVFNMIQSRDC